MRFGREIEQLNLEILQGNLDQAESLLQLLKPESNAEHRTIAHFKGIIFFQRGEVTRAKTQFEFALQTFGENVNLLRDLIVCQYHLQDMISFRSNLARLEQQLNEKQDHLSPRSLIECEVMVGKFLEEEARLLPAIEFYNRALSHAITAAHKLRALIQKARWHALYEPGLELSQLYRELISVPRANITKDMAIELEHSLMLMELRLIGADHASLRLLNLDDSVPEIDRRLLYFDFIEGVLLQERGVSQAVLEKMNSFKTLDPYEQFIEKLVKGIPEGQTYIAELSVLSSQLPWASYLRLLCLAANLETRASVRVELNRKIQLIVRALDPKSQELWGQRLKEALQAPEIRVEYSSKRRSVAIQGRQVDLAKKKMGMQLLNALTHKTEMSVDDAITLLWQSSFSPEHYHRLRMGIHRLNVLIYKATGLGKIIEVDSQHVRLRPEVKITEADDSFANLISI